MQDGVKLESCRTDERCCGCGVNQDGSLAVICSDGMMMRFVVHCSFAEQIMTEQHTAEREEVSRPLSSGLQFLFYIKYVVKTVL